MNCTPADTTSSWTTGPLPHYLETDEEHPPIQEEVDCVFVLCDTPSLT